MTRRRPRTTVSRRIGQRASRLIAVASIVSVALTVGAAPAQAVVMQEEGQGPLERIEITDDLNCAVDHVLDAQGEFFADTACGTLVATDGTLFGPEIIPAGDAAVRTFFSKVDQSGVTGTGTPSDPYRIETMVGLGETGLSITQVDTYVDGEESYRTDVTISNAGAEAADAILYRAGDCFLGDSDAGFGSENVTTGAIACVEGVLDPETSTRVPGDRIIQWLPISAGSDYLEAGFDEVWAAIGAQESFPNTCRCEEYIDNGAGISWDVSVPAGGSVTRSHLTTFSPEGTEPLTTSKTADAETSEPGGTNGYTITISNPNAGAVTLDTIFDTLPAGFSYVAGSTSGLTTDDPTVDGQTLTWTDPGTVPGMGDASLSFDVIVASEPGTYTNEAGGTAEGFTVAPTGETAPITVTEPETEADLSITKSDDAPFGPDPVSSEGTVAYVLSVANNGPDPATEVTVVDAPQGGAVTSASGSGWTCTVDGESNTATCDLDDPLGDDETAEDLLVQVEAPASAENTEISDTATVSSVETDSEPDNDSDTETTAVIGSSNPATMDHAQTFYDGTQEVTLQTTRDPQGGFYSILIIPPGLDPGVVSIVEFPTDGSVEIPGVPNPGTFCGGRGCVGQFQVTVLPGGRTSAQDPIKVIWIYTDGTGGNQLYVQGDGETVASVVKDCKVDGIARPAKCRDSITRLPNMDREYVMLWRDGADPVGAKRK